MVTKYSILKTYASVFANATSIAATRHLNMIVVGVLSYEVLGCLRFSFFWFLITIPNSVYKIISVILNWKGYVALYRTCLYLHTYVCTYTTVQCMQCHTP